MISPALSIHQYLGYQSGEKKDFLGVLQKLFSKIEFPNFFMQEAFTRL